MGRPRSSPPLTPHPSAHVAPGPPVGQGAPCRLCKMGVYCCHNKTSQQVAEQRAGTSTQGKEPPHVYSHRAYQAPTSGAFGHFTSKHKTKRRVANTWLRTILLWLMIRLHHSEQADILKVFCACVSRATAAQSSAVLPSRVQTPIIHSY